MQKQQHCVNVHLQVTSLVQRELVDVQIANRINRLESRVAVSGGGGGGLREWCQCLVSWTPHNLVFSDAVQHSCQEHFPFTFIKIRQSPHDVHSDSDCPGTRKPADLNWSCLKCSYLAELCSVRHSCGPSAFGLICRVQVV